MCEGANCRWCAPVGRLQSVCVSAPARESNYVGGGTQICKLITACSIIISPVSHHQQNRSFFLTPTPSVFFFLTLAPLPSEEAAYFLRNLSFISTLFFSSSTLFFCLPLPLLLPRTDLETIELISNNAGVVRVFSEAFRAAGSKPQGAK